MEKRKMEEKLYLINERKEKILDVINNEKKKLKVLETDAYICELELKLMGYEEDGYE